MVIKCYKQILYAFQGRTSAARTLLDSHVNCEISIVGSFKAITQRISFKCFRINFILLVCCFPLVFYLTQFCIQLIYVNTNSPSIKPAVNCGRDMWIAFRVSCSQSYEHGNHIERHKRRKLTYYVAFQTYVTSFRINNRLQAIHCIPSVRRLPLLWAVDRHSPLAHRFCIANNSITL